MNINTNILVMIVLAVLIFILAVICARILINIIVASRKIFNIIKRKGYKKTARKILVCLCLLCKDDTIYML